MSIKAALLDLLNGSLFGHPIHVMLVHFPVALIPASWLLNVFAFMQQQPALMLGAFYILIFGTLLGFIAIIFGGIDYLKLSANHPAWNKASLHGLLNTTWMVCCSIIVAYQFKFYPDIPIFGFNYLLIFGLLIIGMIFSSFLGGELVFRFGLGAKKI